MKKLFWLKLGAVTAAVGFAWWSRGGRELYERLIVTARSAMKRDIEEAGDAVVEVAEEVIGAVLDETKRIALELDDS